MDAPHHRDAVTAPGWQAAAPVVLLASVGAMIALLLPLTAGAFWPVAAAQAVRHWYTVRQYTDPISPLPVRGGAWTLQPWAAAQAMRGIWNIAGPGGLSALGALLSAVTVVGTYRASRERARALPAILAVLVTLPLTFPPLTATQLFGTVCFALLVWQLRRGAWWWALPLIVVWTNTHGSAVVGAGVCVFGALGAYGQICPRFRHWRTRMVWGVLCCVMVFVTPLGLHLIPYIQSIRHVPHIRTLTPVWRPLGVRSWQLWIGLIVLVLGLRGILLAAPTRRARRSLPILGRVVVLVGFALFAVQAERNVIWFAILVTPEIATLFDRVRPHAPGFVRSGPIAASLYIAAIAGVIVLFPGGQAQRKFALASMPRPALLHAAVQRDGVRFGGVGREDVVISTLEWADYVHLETGAKVWADARLERYAPADIDRYIAMHRGHAAAVRAAIREVQGATAGTVWVVSRHDSASRWFDLIEHPQRLFGHAAPATAPTFGTGPARGVRAGVRSLAAVSCQERSAADSCRTSGSVAGPSG